MSDFESPATFYDQTGWFSPANTFNIITKVKGWYATDSRVCPSLRILYVLVHVKKIPYPAKQTCNLAECLKCLCLCQNALTAHPSQHVCCIGRHCTGLAAVCVRSLGDVPEIFGSVWCPACSLIPAAWDVDAFVSDAYSRWICMSLRAASLESTVANFHQCTVLAVLLSH